MPASEQQHRIARAWAAGLPRQPLTRRDAEARFDRAEEAAELEAERNR